MQTCMSGSNSCLAFCNDFATNMTFQSGKSGNPRGKRPGTRNKKLELLRSSDERLQKKLLEMALAGDIGALKIIADRIWPRLRAEAAGVSIDVVSIDCKSDDLSEQGRSVIDAGLRGEISTDVLRDLLSALFAQAKIVELAEFEDRLKELEGHRIAPPWEVDRPVKLINDQEKLPMRGNKRRIEK